MQGRRWRRLHLQILSTKCEATSVQLKRAQPPQPSLADVEITATSTQHVPVQAKTHPNSTWMRSQDPRNVNFNRRNSNLDIRSSKNDVVIYFVASRNLWPILFAALCSIRPHCTKTHQRCISHGHLTLTYNSKSTTQLFSASANDLVMQMSFSQG